MNRIFLSPSFPTTVAQTSFRDDAVFLSPHLHACSRIKGLSETVSDCEGHLEIATLGSCFEDLCLHKILTTSQSIS